MTGLRTCISLGMAIIAAPSIVPFAYAQNTPGPVVVVQMRDGTEREEHTWGWRGISSDEVDGGSNTLQRSAVRLVCWRAAWFPSGACLNKSFDQSERDDVVVWQNGSRTKGHVDSVECSLDVCRIRQNGEERPGSEVDYVQFAPNQA